MKDLFKDILAMEDVKGVLLLSREGEVLYRSFPQSHSAALDGVGWGSLVEPLERLREADLVFQKSRLYIRKAEIGFLIVWTGFFVSSPLLRLNCDVVIPALKAEKGQKSFKRFFKK